MKEILYKRFDYRFLYLGVTLGNPFILKVGIARDVWFRWSKIGESMKWTIEFPIFFLPMFFARETEKHIHNVLDPWNKPIRRTASGWTEWFWWIVPLSWPRWVYSFGVIFLNFTLSHLSIILPILYGYSIVTDREFFDLLLRISTFLGGYIDLLEPYLEPVWRFFPAIGSLLGWLELVNQVIRMNKKKGIQSRKFSWREFL